jgi:hypothetical protein
MVNPNMQYTKQVVNGDIVKNLRNSEIKLRNSSIGSNSNLGLSSSKNQPLEKRSSFTNAAVQMFGNNNMRTPKKGGVDFASLSGLAGSQMQSHINKLTAGGATHLRSGSKETRLMQ